MLVWLKAMSMVPYQCLPRRTRVCVCVCVSMCVHVCGLCLETLVVVRLLQEA